MAGLMAGHVYLDANVLISIVEMADRLTVGQIDFLTAIESGRTNALSSDLALAECLVRPLLHGDLAGIDAFEMLFTSGAFDVAPLDRKTMVEAVLQRAQHRMKLPDAMHVAVAVVSGCAGFVTADRGIRLPDSLARIDWDAIPPSEQVG